MKIEIQVPNTINDIKLKDYQEFLEYIKKEEDENLIQLKMIELFCNFDRNAVSKIKASSISEITTHINGLFESDKELTKIFKMGNKEFGFITNLDEMTLGEYIDLDNYLGDFNEIHRAMSVLYRPIIKKKRAWFSRKETQYIIEDYTGTKEYSDLMLHMPLGIALGAYFFFLNLRTELLNSTVSFLEQEIVKNQKLISAGKVSLIKNGVGIAQYTNSLMVMLSELKKSQNLTYTNVLHI